MEAIPAAKLIEVVVLPTPPFWLAIAITLPIIPPLFLNVKIESKEKVL
jgi:hypothetical protein